MLPNVVLIGFMGCGKSSVGRRLAALTGHRFVDTDDLIIQAENMSIAEIFAAGGEESFRDIEERTIEGFVGVAGIVLADTVSSPHEIACLIVPRARAFANGDGQAWPRSSPS